MTVRPAFRVPSSKRCWMKESVIPFGFGGIVKWKVGEALGEPPDLDAPESSPEQPLSSAATQPGTASRRAVRARRRVVGPTHHLRIRERALASPDSRTVALGRLRGAARR